jgi:HPt (histidine-containing phosphotransfer) domain-containing protein
MRAALQQGDMELAQRLAHTLKGVAGTIGADKLAVLARQLESAIKLQDAALYAGCLQELDDEMALALAAAEG